MVLADRAATAMERTLPGRYFVDPEIYRREQANIFAAMWVCVGRADELPSAGDYLTTEVAGESVVVVRAKDGELHAHLNVCRHRGPGSAPRRAATAVVSFSAAITPGRMRWTVAWSGRPTSSARRA